MGDEPTDGGFEAALEALEIELHVIEAACAALETGVSARCAACGTERRTGDPILCRVCGEPVLDDGWVP